MPTWKLRGLVETDLVEMRGTRRWVCYTLSEQGHPEQGVIFVSGDYRRCLDHD